MSKDKKNKVLVVEDDIFLAGIYSKKFSNEGYDTMVVSDGKKALSVIKQKKPDIVLLDVMLPVMDGFEVLRNIKRDRSIKNIPIILLTNLSDQCGIKKGYDLGIKDYVIKSFFTPGEVVEKIRKYI